MIADYHIHTKLCKHATDEMEDYVRQAIRLGLKEIAFTDHIPLPNCFDLAHRMAENELDGYINRTRQLQKQYPQITIRTGIEADFYDGFEEYLREILQRSQFDLTIMSVHFIHGWPKNNWAFSYHFPDKDLKEIYSDYLQALIRGIKTGLFDVVGHLDLIKSPGNPVWELNREELEQVLRLAKEHGMAIELNTSGLRREINEVYPDLSLLRQISELGLPVTLGSDAHSPADVGFKFAELEEKIAEFPNLKLAKFPKEK